MSAPVRRLIAIAASSALALLGFVAVGASPATADGTTRYVATSGSDASNSCLVQVSPCKTLGHALAVAASDNTILLAPGTYRESDNPAGTSNTVPAALHDLTIDSNGGTASNTTIDATGFANGLVVNSDRVTVQHLTLKNADLQGIAVRRIPSGAPVPVPISGFTLAHSIITSNGLCYEHPAAPDCPLPSAGLANEVIGPCYEEDGAAVDLQAVVDSTVDANSVTHNVGGIVLADGAGPSHGNTISNNNASNNLVFSGLLGRHIGGCGIALAGHNLLAVAKPGVDGGVYDNTVVGNTVNANFDAGIAVTGALSGAGVFDNTITGNTANDNGLAGVAIYSTAPSQNMNGNVITGNHVSHDALSGKVGGPGDLLAQDFHTTGILVFSGAAPITGTVVTGNDISENFYGVWLSQKTPSENIADNTISFDTGGSAIYLERPVVAPIAGIARTPSGHGYWLVQTDGAVFPFGDAGYYGSLGGTPLARPIVGMATTSTGQGYWLVASDGGIFSFGDAHFYGSTGNIHLNQPVVGMTPTPTDHGYWFVAADGGVFSYGDAHFLGSMGAVRLNRPVVGMASGPNGAGYWLDASDGGIFSFGSARFHGSMGAVRLNQPAVGMTSGPNGAGYWLVASDGGIFSFGSATFHGSTGAIQLAQPIVAMTSTPSENGYWFTARDGGVFAFGDAPYEGSVPAIY